MRTKNDHPLPEDVLAHLKRLLLNRRPEITEKTLEDFFAYVERAQYAPSSGSAEEYQKFLDELYNIYDFQTYMDIATKQLVDQGLANE